MEYQAATEVKVISAEILMILEDWESNQFIVPSKQGNACGGRGLTVEPSGRGYILRTQMRVKDSNKTVLGYLPHVRESCTVHQFRK